MDTINKDMKLREIETQLDERINLEEAISNKKRKSISYRRYASWYLYDIERFVEDVRDKGWKGGFLEERTLYGRVLTIRELYLGKKYYKLLNRWLRQYSDLHLYSLNVRIFYDVCKSMALIGRETFWFGEVNDVHEKSGMRYMEIFNTLIKEIRACSPSRKYKEQERWRIKNTRNNERNVLAMENAMFSDQHGRSRWLVLSITLKYKPRYRRWITPETIQLHRDRLLTARRYNKLLAGIGSYVWAIEEGEDTGLHLHLVIFYSAESNHDEYIAKAIGEYWEHIVTEGKGDYWNSNTEERKGFYDRHGHGIGVGQINWNDLEKRKALRVNLVYLAKAEQYLMIKGLGNIRTFGMGSVPKKIVSGRPRIVSSVLVLI